MAKKKESQESGKSGNGRHERRGAMTPREPRPPLASPGPLSRLRGEFDRLFDDFFQGWPSLDAFSGEHDRWGLEVQDRDDAIVLRADAPGFQPGDFDIQIRGNKLVLSASESEETDDDDKGYRWQKREFYRSMPLPAEIDVDKIDAQYHNGVLTMTLPKTEPSKGRKIEIKD
jgi:HSP20 family protein